MFFATRRSRTVGNNFRIRPARPAKLLQRPALQQTSDHCTARRGFLVAAPNVRGLARGCRKEFAPPPRAPVSREDCPLTEVQLLELHRQRNPQVARRNSRSLRLERSPPFPPGPLRKGSPNGLDALLGPLTDSSAKIRARCAGRRVFSRRSLWRLPFPLPTNSEQAVAASLPVKRGKGAASELAR